MNLMTQVFLGGRGVCVCVRVCLFPLYFIFLVCGVVGGGQSDKRKICVACEVPACFVAYPSVRKA